MTSEEITRAVRVLRESGNGPIQVMYRLACMSFGMEAFAEWLERHPEDPRVQRAAREVCGHQDALLDAYLRYAETGKALPG